MPKRPSNSRIVDSRTGSAPFVAEQVAPYNKIRRLEFVEAIPKSASGKILRRLLVERERKQQT